MIITSSIYPSLIKEGIEMNILFSEEELICSFITELKITNIAFKGK